MYCYMSVNHGGLIPVEFCSFSVGGCDNVSMFIMIYLGCLKLVAGCVMLF